MAYKLFPFHNIEATVGAGGINRSDDVILVQGLLDICFGMRTLEEMQRVCKELGGASPARKVKVDGVYSDEIAAYIEMMQRHYCKRASSVTVDGKLDPVPREHGWFDIQSRTKSGKEYFLVVLNTTAISVNAKAFLGLGDRIGVSFKIGIKGVGQVAA
jgi:hypothetical protein